MKTFIAAAVLAAAFAVSAGTETPVAKVGCESVSVSAGFTNAVVKLRNDGATDAVEAVQIYVSTPNSGKGAPSALPCGLARVAVPAGKSVEASVAIDADAFAEAGEDGAAKPVAGRCTVWAATVAPSGDGRGLGVRSCSTVVDAKPRLLFFRSERCRRCIRLEKELFSTQKWFDFAEGRITLERVDMGGIDEHPLAARYGVDRKGTFVLTSAGGGCAAARLEACEDPSVVLPWLRGAIVSGD